MKSIYFTEEHELFRQTVRQFMEQEVAPNAAAWEEAQRIPRDIWRRMGEMGFLGIPYSERYGGAGVDLFYSIIFLEELARSGMGGFCAAVGVQQFIAPCALYHQGSEELKEKYLVPTISGEKVGAIAVTEPNAGSDVASMRTNAVRDGDHWVINGSKTFITNGVYGDFFVVGCKTDKDAGAGGISLIVVDADTPGVKTNKLKKIGWMSSDTGEIFFEDVRVPVSNLVGQENMGFYYIMQSFGLERLVAAGTAIGSCVATLEETLEYMKSREAFGRPINRFQALRHRIADLFSETEAVRQLVYHATWLLSQGEQPVKECSMAKLLATELNKKVVDECLQFFGGFGYIEEYPIARAYRDVRVSTIVAGTSEIMREIIAKVEIDGMRFPKIEDRAVREKREAQEAPAAPAPEPVPSGGSTATLAVPTTVAELLLSLPERLKVDKVAGWNTRVHFKFKDASRPEWTVVIEDGTCKVSEGLEGEPKCVVNTREDVYLNIESGKQDPQAAFLMGKIKISNIGEMMRFMKSFRQVRA